MRQGGVRKNLFVSVLVAFMVSMPVPASAFDLMGLFLKKALEDPVQEVVENGIKEAILKSITGGMSQSGKKGNNKNDKTKVNLPDPIPGPVEEGNYRALPLTGDYRFPVPKNTPLNALKIGPNGGYMDRFGDEWIPYRINGRIVAWRCNLSDMGHNRMRWAVKEARFFVVRPDGNVVKS